MIRETTLKIAAGHVETRLNYSSWSFNSCDFPKTDIPNLIWPTFYPSIYFAFLSLSQTATNMWTWEVYVRAALWLHVYQFNGWHHSLLNDIWRMEWMLPRQYLLCKECALNNIHPHTPCTINAYVHDYDYDDESHFKVQRYNKNDMTRARHGMAWHRMAQWYTGFESAMSQTWHDLNYSER